VDKIAPPVTVTPPGFRELSDQVRRAGLLDRRPVYYTFRIAATVGVYLGAWALFVRVGDSWITLLCAALLGGAFTQVLFIGHDAGHGQISSSRAVNRAIGLIAGNLLTGMSFGWWVPKHNAHHAYPNQPGRDPDIGPGIVAFSFTGQEAAGRSGVARFVARWQAWLFIPLLIAEGVGLHITSADWAIRRRDRAAAAESALLVAHLAIYATVVFLVLSPLHAVAFMAVNQGVLGLYLGASFAPNHKGMPMLEPGRETSFASRQVVTARNVRGGPAIDFLLGGLNHQIEHHLFPSMPRVNLARADPLVRAFCAGQDLPYCETDLADSYRATLRHLASVSRSAGRA
jgi:fatty acid desaturase